MRSSRRNSLLSIISMMYRFNSMKRMSSRLLASSLRVSSNSSISSFGMGSVGSSSLGRWRTFLICASSEALSESPLNKSIDELKKQYSITASSTPRINTLSHSCATNTFFSPPHGLFNVDVSGHTHRSVQHKHQRRAGYFVITDHLVFGKALYTEQCLSVAVVVFACEIVCIGCRIYGGICHVVRFMYLFSYL